MSAALICLWAAAVGQTLFVLVYGSRPWWRHFVGSALFTKSLSLALTLDVVLLNHYVDYPYERAVWLVLLFVMAVAVWSQFVALMCELRKHRKVTGAAQEETP